MMGLRAAAWLVSGALSFGLLMLPVSVGAQWALSSSAIGAMLVVWAVGRGQLARQVFLALGTAVVIRYMYWRLTSTMPSPGDPLSFGLGVVLVAAEVYCVLILFIGLVINADPLRRQTPDRGDEEALPVVDVFIPTYNEDEDILATTLAAALSMDYPREKLNVWLLDDGGTEQKCNDANPKKAETARLRRASLQTLCRQMGALYLTRKKNEHAKAGNMNNGLAYARGDIVLVFDADHAPFRSFLRETVGHFAKDPKLFLVQTPHVFLNPDPIERNLGTFVRMPSENEMFYSITQRGLDKWNGSFFCGSAALLRRSALETAGGFSGVTITEDCETAFELHANGWTSVFVDKPLIAGLQPETFASFIGQRSRWCQGMFQILLLKNPAFKRGLHIIQRIAYLSSMTFWFFPLPRLIFMFAPLTYIFFDVKIFVSNIDEAIGYTASYVVVNAMLQNFIFGRVRWPWVSELYEYLQGVYLAKAIVSVAWNPRKPTFNVTAKGQTLAADHLSPLSRPFLIIYALLVAGAITAGWRYAFEPGVGNLMLVVGSWNAFNLLIAGAALGAVCERKQTRAHPRLDVERKATMLIDEKEISVVVANVSPGGCGMRLVGAGEGIEWRIHQTQARLQVERIGEGPELEALPLRYKQVAVRGGEPLYGFAFDKLEPAHYFTLADLMYGDASALANFLEGRRRHKTIVGGAFEMIRWGLVGPARALRLMLSPNATQPGAANDAAPAIPTHWLHRLARRGRANVAAARAPQSATAAATRAA
jgi:cellulose synthase (UDP-forming)